LFNNQQNILNLPQSQRVGTAGYVNTNLELYKTLCFVLSHEFSPDGELFCEYIMLQSCKSMFC